MFCMSFASWAIFSHGRLHFHCKSPVGGVGPGFTCFITVEARILNQEPMSSHQKNCAEICAIIVAITSIAAKIKTSVGPTFMPGVSSSKNLMSPAPPEGIGESPFFFFLFLLVLGIILDLLGWKRD